jgi:hypothetical protein
LRNFSDPKKGDYTHKKRRLLPESMAFHEDGNRVSCTFKQDEAFMDTYVFRLTHAKEGETGEHDSLLKGDHSRQTFEKDTDLLFSPDFNKGISYSKASHISVELHV